MDSDFDSLRSEYLCIECDFRLSSIEALFFNALRGFLVEQWYFLMVWKVVKCLIFQGFVEVGIEVVFEVKCLGNVDFTRGLWIEEICRSWLPVICPKM